ncbi:SCP2 sterol-binding domain-containing protein [Undibacterium sp. Ji22W]|uniref:SCP2 sterol-binding domain-containing protein n=1 Tax=Undibacterium sp. Ji22W TaxID=3413038 RepID=UPI003BF104CD
MDLPACTEKIRQKLGQNSSLNATLKFDCGDDGVIFVDALANPHFVNNQNAEASCTVSLTLSDLVDLLAGQLNPVSGFMSGKLKLAGDMSIAMRLQKVV